MGKSLRTVLMLAIIPFGLTQHLTLSHGTETKGALHLSAPPFISTVRPQHVGDLYGLGTYMAQRYPSLAVPSLYRVHLTDTDWVREEFTASHIHSAAQAPLRFRPYDYVVSREVENKLHILGLLDYNNTFNGQDHVEMPHRHIVSLVNDFVRFAYAVAFHYRHSIFAWQVWNEPNLAHYWMPVPSASDYAYLLRRTYKAIKDANPEARVVIAGPSASDPNAVDFLSAVARDNGLFDDVAIQPYSYVPTAEIFHQVAQLRVFHKPIWFTEIGWAGRSGCAPCGDPAAETTYLGTIYLLSAVSGVSHVFWYDFRDDGRHPRYSDNFGLVRCDLGPKPAYWVYILGARILNHATLLGIGRVNANLSMYEFRNAGVNFFAVWNRSQTWRFMNVPWHTGSVRVLNWQGHPGLTNRGGVLQSWMPPDSVQYIVPTRWSYAIQNPGSVRLPPRSSDRDRLRTC